MKQIKDLTLGELTEICRTKHCQMCPLSETSESVCGVSLCNELFGNEVCPANFADNILNKMVYESAEQNPTEQDLTEQNPAPAQKEATAVNEPKKWHSWQVDGI